MKLRTLKLSSLFLIAGVASFSAIAEEVAGEYNNQCALGITLEQHFDTDCSISHEIDGKTYCFGNDDARATFLEDAEANVAKADKYYAEKEKSE